MIQPRAIPSGIFHMVVRFTRRTARGSYIEFVVRVTLREIFARSHRKTATLERASAWRRGRSGMLFTGIPRVIEYVKRAFDWINFAPTRVFAL